MLSSLIEHNTVSLIMLIRKRASRIRSALLKYFFLPLFYCLLLWIQIELGEVSKKDTFNFKTEVVWAAEDFYGTPVNVLKIFGQKNFKESSRDTVTASKIYHAAGVVVDKSATPNRIYVADTGNNRILGFSSLGNCANNPAQACTNDLDCPDADSCLIDGKKEADIVIGQPDFSSASCNGDNNLGMFNNPDKGTLCLMRFPLSANLAEMWQRLNLDVDNEGNLYVADVHNNRVLRYRQPFSTDNQADFVWGQDDFYSNGVNKGLGRNERNSSSLFIGYDWILPTARGVSVDNFGNVWIADSHNGRMLRFPPNSKEADLVIGQKDFESFDKDMCEKPIDYSLEKLCTPILAKVHPASGELYVLDETAQRAFEARILVFKPPFYNGMSADRFVIPKQDGPFENWDWEYYLQASGFTFNTYKEGEYADGEIWINEHWTKRTILIDDEGEIIKVIGALDKYHEGCKYRWVCQSNINKYSLCWPGGSIGIDNANNIYLADESNHRITRFALPYETYQEGEKTCLPNANGGLVASDLEANDPNAISGYKFTESLGVFSFEDQLVVRDKERFLVWNNYLEKEPGVKADFVVGQDSEDVRSNNEFQLGENSFHTIDDKNRLWSFNGHGKIVIYQLPFHERDRPLANFVSLYWPSGEEVDYSGIAYGYGGPAFDNRNKKMFIVDNKNHRILRVSNYDEYQNKLYVDMVIGQPSKDSVKCNHDQDYSWLASGAPTADSLCAPTQIKFDRLGNLYVVENGYECHGNNRISVFMAEDLSSAAELFPNIAAKKVFTRSSLTEPANCQWGRTDAPSSPVSLAFNSRNQMVVANDGSYHANEEERHLRQLWFYNDPLKKDVHGNYVQNQSADAYIKIPMGVPAELWFDTNDNLIVRDGTWCRVWVINLEQDPFWLVWLTEPTPTAPPIITTPTLTPTPTPTPTPIFLYKGFNQIEPSLLAGQALSSYPSEECSLVFQEHSFWRSDLNGEALPGPDVFSKYYLRCQNNTEWRR